MKLANPGSPGKMAVKMERDYLNQLSVLFKLVSSVTVRYCATEFIMH